MGSETSEAKHPTFMEAKAVTIPRIPQEIIGEILSHFNASDSDLGTLQSCALVSRSWAPLCRRHLFHTVVFTSRNVAKWLETFPVPEESPARHVRDLRFLIHDPNIPEELFEYTRWFTNVQWVVLSGYGDAWLLRPPRYWRLPRSVTSLEVAANTTLQQMRDIMAQMPNLNHLSLSGHILARGRGLSVGIGMVLRGTFGGQLRLLEGYADDDVINMLMEVPTGLHFTEVQISCTYQHLFSAGRLVEACGENLVKLSYTISANCESHHFSWSSWF